MILLLIRSSIESLYSKHHKLNFLRYNLYLKILFLTVILNFLTTVMIELISIFLLLLRERLTSAALFDFRSCCNVNLIHIERSVIQLMI